MLPFTHYVVESAHRWEAVSIDGERGTGFTNSVPPDDYYYHVTTADAAAKILASNTLKPMPPRMGRGGHAGHSKGRVFMTDRNGVFFWYTRAEEHAFDMSEDEPDIKVLRIPKSAAPQAQIDDPGTRDARAKAYFNEGPIPAK